MRNFKILKTGIQTVFILGVIWTIFFFATAVYNKLDNNNLNHIPSNAYFLIQIDASQLLKESIEGLLVTEDNEIVQLLKDLQSEGTDSEGKKTGIALNTDVLLFTLEEDNQNFYGVLFNLTSQQDFRDYFKGNKQKGVASNDEVGMVLSSSETESNLEAFAEKIFNGKHATIDFKTTQEAITIWTKNTDKTFERLDVKIKEEKIHFSGEISNQLKHKKSIHGLKPSGFHATTSIVPNQFNDSIRKRFGDSIPRISGISINYFGTEIIEEPEFLIAPEADFLIQFESAINLEYYMNAFHKRLIVDSISGNTCFYGPKSYFSKQISENTIYLGVHAYDSTNLVIQNSIVHLTGTASNLTQIDGGGFFKRILEIIPSYNASKQFTEHIETFEISLKEKNAKTITVSGDILFKEGEYAAVEFLRLLLVGQLFQ